MSQNIEVTTIPALLKTADIRHNQTKLAKLLGINRGSLRKHLFDEDGKDHFVVYRDDKLVVYTPIKPSNV